MATSVDGTRIAWYRYGGGDRAVLFVPTWNIVDARVLGHQVAALEPHATVVTYDPRGAGASDRPERGCDFPLHGADASAVMDATGIERVALATASRGVNAAVLLTADRARLETASSPARDLHLPDARRPRRSRRGRPGLARPEHRGRHAKRAARVDSWRGRRPDIRTPELVNPLLLEFLLDA